MPELPEVELISKSLDSLVKGRTISFAGLLCERLAPDISPAEFSKTLRKTKINFVHRRGKFILFDLSGGKTLIVHLRMSGRFSLLPAERENPKFTHAVLHFDDQKLVFDDQRHFGLMKVVRTHELYTINELKKLAPEPFSDDFSVEYLYGKTKATKRNLKEFLIDQTKVCGLGNIYACEAMFTAAANPQNASNKLSEQSVIRLHESIRSVLHEAVTHKICKIDPENLESNYFSGSISAGWLVYDRENEPCRNCKTPIVRLKHGGRSTYFCPQCQRR